MNKPAHCAHAADDDWRALAESVAQELGTLDPDNTLGIVYASDRLADDFEAVVGLLGDRTGLRHWVGTLGYGVSVAGREFYDCPALAALALPIAAEEFRILEPAADGCDPLEGHGAWIARHSPGLGLVHAAASAPHLLQDLIELGETAGCFVVGGLTASRNGALTVADRVRADSLSGVLFADTVPLATAIAQGCAPVGKVHRVTAADRNLVFELDGEPALKVLYADLGVSDVEGLRAYADVLNAALPVENSDRAEYLVRNVLAVDPKCGLVVIGDVLSPGAPLQFCRRDRDAALADLDAMLADLQGRLPGRPRAAVYITCVARGPNLFGEKSEEIRRICDGLGPVPVIGLFANGEIFNGRLHGYTGVLTVFC
ncbi:MAG: FIST C-terminal domain-containing protein [Alphaproteobacteria bacterium]